MFAQGVDPELDLSNIDEAIEVFEKFNKMPIHSRHPYAGDMAYVAFSGSHQDAIKKSFDMFDEHPDNKWANPYLTIDPSDIGRKYEPIMINSQSGKGGVSYVMEKKYGYTLPKDMLTEFAALINDLSDEKHTVLDNEEIHQAFKDAYTNLKSPLVSHSYSAQNDDQITVVSATIEYDGKTSLVSLTLRYVHIQNTHLKENHLQRRQHISQSRTTTTTSVCSGVLVFMRTFQLHQSML